MNQVKIKYDEHYSKLGLELYNLFGGDYTANRLGIEEIEISNRLKIKLQTNNLKANYCYICYDEIGLINIDFKQEYNSKGEFLSVNKLRLCGIHKSFTQINFVNCLNKCLVVENKNNCYKIGSEWFLSECKRAPQECELFMKKYESTDEKDSKLQMFSSFLKGYDDARIESIK